LEDEVLRYEDALLSREVAYSVSPRDQDGEIKTSRVALKNLKKENEWRIVHGHLSYLPE